MEDQPGQPPAYDLTGGLPDADDLELAGEVTSPPGSPLAQLEAELLRDLGQDLTRLDVTGRPGWVAVYRRDFTSTNLEAWRARAKAGGKRSKVDLARFAAIVLAGTMVALEQDGATVTDPDEDDATPLTVRSPYLQRLYGVTTAAEAARRFFGTDGYVAAQLEAVLEGAGWGDEASDADDADGTADPS